MRSLIDGVREDELRSISTRLGIDYGQLPETIKTRKSRKVLGLLMYLNARGQTVNDILGVCEQIRPDIAWQALLEKADAAWEPSGAVSKAVIHKQ